MKDKEIEEMAKDFTETRARGYKIENGKLVFFSNMLDGYRHEYKDLQEICEEMNGMLEKHDSYMTQIDFWKSEAGVYRLWKDKLVEQYLDARKKTAKEILQEVGKACGDYQWFKNLCKEFGVEVEV